MPPAVKAMFLEKIKQLLKNGMSSVVVLENEKPAYVILEYSFFEKLIQDKEGIKKINKFADGQLNDLTKELFLEELEEENIFAEEKKQAEFNLSDLPI